MITYMRVNHIVNIIRCQAASFEAVDDVRSCSIWLAGGEMLLYSLWIPTHVSAQAQVEDYARRTVCDGADMLYQEA